MHAALKDLDALFQPIGAEAFINDYFDQKPLHLKGSADKFQEVMTWSHLGNLLSQLSLWSQRSMELVLDKQRVAPDQYCAPAIGRDGHQVLRPDAKKVKAFLSRGATLVANDIDYLTPGMRQVASLLETAFGAKAQANLYLSSKRRQGFSAHYDTHDVFALHVEGEKTWHLYSGRGTHPIAHPAFELPMEQKEREKGELVTEVRMQPGDLLYLPRGWYHDALADDGGCVHIAMGLTYPIGLDVLGTLFERCVAEPAFRQNLPRDPAALKEYLETLGAKLYDVVTSDPVLQQTKALQSGFAYDREAYHLPDLLEEPAIDFQVQANGIRLVEQGGRFGLLKEGQKGAVEVPANVSPMVAWVLERDAFALSDLCQAFSKEPKTNVEQFVEDMKRMALIRAA
ncbi:MAG: cupin domain-containing protein [Geminicoccaceae bacterium]